jgi:hypothetical protein
MKERERVRTEIGTGQRSFERLQLTEQEFEFLKGQLGSKSQFLDKDAYVDVVKGDEKHLSHWT